MVLIPTWEPPQAAHSFNTYSQISKFNNFVSILFMYTSIMIFFLSSGNVPPAAVVALFLILILSEKNVFSNYM